MQGFFQNKLFPLFKTLGSFAGSFQARFFQQGNLSSVDHTHDILFDHIFCQVKFEGTEGISGNCNAVLPFFPVGKGHFRLDLQFLLFRFRNILAGKQDFTRSAVFSFQAYDIHMIPLGTAMPVYMTLKTHIIVSVKRFPHRIFADPARQLPAFVFIR